MIKTCDTCGKEKAHVYFYFDHKNDDNRKTSCIACDKHRKKMDKKNILKRNKEDARRNPDKHELVLYKRRSASNIIQSVYKAENIPLFMQFNHLIYKHVKDKHKLNFNKLNLLMLVFPLCPFPRRDFLDCRELMNYNEVGLMKYFIDNDFVYIWRNHIPEERVPTLYDFTDKGKLLIKDVHEWALGKKEIPEVDSSNALDILARIRGF
jgi:hypothetical protein